MAVRVETLSRALIRRSIRLLDMEYKPAEIAAELGAKKEQIIRLVSAGAPARKDRNGFYWIHGEKFREWLLNAAPKNPKEKNIFSDNEAFCTTCRSTVVFVETYRRHHIVFGTCPKGHKTVRFISLKGKTDKKRKVKKNDQ